MLVHVLSIQYVARDVPPLSPDPFERPVKVHRATTKNSYVFGQLTKSGGIDADPAPPSTLPMGLDGGPSGGDGRVQAGSALARSRCLLNDAGVRLPNVLERSCLALLVVPWLLGACSGKDPKTADDVANKPRQTEMVHEECDLEDADATVLDADHDGRPEVVRVMDGGREVCRAADINGDGIIDSFSYFDEQGRLKRRESGFDRDAHPDEISYYESGVLVRKERETNYDKRIDTWDYYEGERLVREERDANGDGFVDQWWLFDRPDQPLCAQVKSDADDDGKPDDETVDNCADETVAPKPAAAAPAGTAPTTPAVTAPAAPTATDPYDVPPTSPSGTTPAAEPTKSEP